MENKDIIALSVNDLKAKIKEEKSLLSKLKINHAVSPIENPMKIRISKTLIARLSTELTKKLNSAK